MYTHETTVKLRDTDAAGVMYFARQFDFAHDAYQEYVTMKGYSFRRLLDENKFMQAIVHAESDYSAPVRCGDRITVQVRAERIGTTSFTIAYEILCNGEPAGEAKTVHVTIDRVTREPIPIPEELRGIIEELA